MTAEEARRVRRAQVEDTLNCIIANLTYAAKLDRHCFVAVHMRPDRFRRNRYRRRNIGYNNFCRVVRGLRDSDNPYIEYVTGFFDRDRRFGMSTRIRATDRLLRTVHKFAAALEQGEVENAEQVAPIVAEAPREEGMANLPQLQMLDKYFVHEQMSDVIRLRETGSKEDIEYDDNAETNAMRQRLEQWNAFARQNFCIDLLISDNEFGNVFNQQNNQNNNRREFFLEEREQTRLVDLSQNQLYRVFNNGTFEHGGRFYGGWRQTIPSRYRRFITINQVPTAEIDYSGMHAAMLYARENAPLPDDPYEIDGIDPRYRKLIKITFMKLINALEGQRIRAPRLANLPESWSWAQIQEAVIAKHEPIARHLHSGAGLWLQKIDAEIAETVMIRMMQVHGLLALPVHDSFLTYIGSAATLREEMKRAYQERMGADIAAKLDQTIENMLLGDLSGLTPEEISLEQEFLNVEDHIERLRDQPGYEGYRDRWQTFLQSRDEAWHRRFGEHWVEP